MTDGQGVRWRAVPLVTAVSAAASWLILAVWRDAGGEPLRLPWVGLVPLLLLSAAVLVAAWQVRRYARHGLDPGRTEPKSAGGPPDRPVRLAAGSGPPPRRVSPQRARGTLVAAQASALGGAALTGWYLANVLLQLPNADVPSVRDLVLRAAASALAALVLAVSGMVAQSWCRLPEDDDDAGATAGEPGDLAFG